MCYWKRKNVAFNWHSIKYKMHDNSKDVKMGGEKCFLKFMKYGIVWEETERNQRVHYPNL